MSEKIRVFKEWDHKSRFNPFNTSKVIKHVEHWKGISVDHTGFKKTLPPPVAVTVDLSNRCNLKCPYCNAKKVFGNTDMSPEWMLTLPMFLKEWGVKAVTVAGGGEPLMNKDAAMFFYSCKNSKLPVALLTNGTRLDFFRDCIRDTCDWIGVSVDAGTPETYAKIKSVPQDTFDKVMSNISMLTYDGVDVTYKFLITADNINDIYKAVFCAKRTGCRQIHIRPMGRTWFDDTKGYFTEGDVEHALGEINRARKDYETDRFKIYGVTHKFGNDWGVENDFCECWASLMYLVIQPNGIISTCCDRRGDEKTILAKDLNSPLDIRKHWGGDRHFKMFKDIDVKKCCRCTFAIHSQIYECMVLEDKTFSDYI